MQGPRSDLVCCGVFILADASTDHLREIQGSNAHGGIVLLKTANRGVCISRRSLTRMNFHSYNTSVTCIDSNQGVFEQLSHSDFFSSRQ